MAKKSEKKLAVKVPLITAPISAFASIVFESLADNPSMQIFERVKLLLEKDNKNVEWLAKQIGMKNKSSLYVAFKKGSVSIQLLGKISKVLNVNIFYFFEADIVERLTEEVAKHQQNPDLKGFLMGFSRDVNKGMKIEDAANKNINPNWLIEKMM